MGLRGPPKGTPRTPGSGRKPGTPNKNTTLLKDAILMAGEAAGDALSLPGKPSGLVGYLEWLAINHPPAFSGLVGKVLPMTVVADQNITAKVTIEGGLPAMPMDGEAAMIASVEQGQMLN